MSSKKLTRRQFIKTSTGFAAAASAPFILPACATGHGPRPAASERITMGCIGVGNQGINDMRGFLQDERVQVVAVCDVNAGSDNGYWSDRPGGRRFAREIVESHYGGQTNAGTFKGVDEYADYRELLARPDIDTVLIALPDHWHAIQVVDAANAGKDIYGEKPLSLTVAEGRIMSDAVKRNGRVFQTGSQQRSDERFRHACELVRNGYIGELNSVKCGLPGGTPDYSKHGHQTAPAPVPDGFDYETWLGPAPETPYIPARSHVNWRWDYNYSGGQVTDWGGHHPDIAQWGMGMEHTGPVEVRNAKATYAKHPIYNTAIEYSFDCVYENGVVLNISNKNRGGVLFEGSEGWVWADRGKIEASSTSLLDVKIGPDEINLYRSRHHARDFIDCVYTGKDPVAPIEVAHRSITISHIGNIAMRLGQDLKWNPDKERFTNSDTANEYLHRPYRGPWKLKGLPKGGRSLAT